MKFRTAIPIWKMDFQAGGCKNFGGIVQKVEFLIAPSVRITDIFARPDLDSGRIRLTVTVRNDSGAPVHLAGRVAAGAQSDGAVLAATTFTEEVAAAEASYDVSLHIPHHRPWTLDDPYLYHVSVTVDTTSTTGEVYHHEQAVRCGFRDFRVVNGAFRLNGKRLWLRSTHTLNHYPNGYYEPADRDLIRRDLINAKAIGLNMVRFIAGMALAEQLDFCDEIGLLVYEENLAAWLLKDSPHMAERFDLSLREMILRDRNHPSLVVWGLLNETHDGPVFRHAVESLALLRELDATRTVLLGSGRWDGDLAIGSVSNPDSFEWENVWGRDGSGSLNEIERSTMHAEPAYFQGAGDAHVYPYMPQSEETNTFLRTLGHDTKPVFLSEYGTGSLLDVVHIMGRFQQASDAPAPDEVVVYQIMRDLLEADWVRYGMDQVYPFPRDLFRESQRLHSRQRVMGLNLIRSNPHIIGYNHTGMLDHVYTGEGLWTLWREWKPGIVDALEDGLAPLRWCMFVNPLHAYAGRQVSLEVVLANQDVLQPGVYPAHFRIFGPAGQVWEHHATVHLPEPSTGEDAPLAVPVFKAQVAIEGPMGTYVLAAHMEQGGSPAGDRVEFFISDPAALPPVQGEVTVWGIGENTTAWLTARGLQCQPFAEQTDQREIILVGDVSPLAPTEEQWCALAARMARGSIVLFLSPRAFKRGDDMVGWLPLCYQGPLLGVPQLALSS